MTLSSTSQIISSFSYVFLFSFIQVSSQQTVGNETIAFGLHFAFVFPLTDILNGYVTNTATNNHVALSSHRSNHLYITYFHVL